MKVRAIPAALHGVEWIVWWWKGFEAISNMAFLHTFFHAFMFLYLKTISSFALSNTQLSSYASSDILKKNCQRPLLIKASKLFI